MTASLELSKLLYEKGLKLETEKWWRIHKQFEEPLYKDCVVLTLGNAYSGMYPREYWDSIPAPSTDELLAVMPREHLCSNYNYVDLIIRPDDEGYFNIHYGSEILITEFGLSNALAEMCLWLLNNGYIYDEKQKMIERKT